MAYLTKSDYTISIAINHLDEILEQAAETSGITADQVRSNHERLAQATIKAYLQTRYDIDAEFAKTAPTPPADDTRDEVVKFLYVDLALCSLHKTINPRDIPELREKACDDAMKLLKELRDGLVSLTITPVNDPAVYVTEVNSQVKFISKPFSDLSLFDEEA